MRTLTETLMDEEAKYTGYGRTASSYMFGAEAWDIKINAPMFSFPEPPKNSSAYGSARAFTPFEFNVPSVTEMFKKERQISSSSYGSALRISSRADKGVAIFSENGGAPLMRLDFEDHHGMPKNHLQYGEHDYTGRHGNEAAEIFASVFVSNTKIKFPWEK
ncbi:MAG: hypothetical protein V1914_01970 [archaeon]